MKETDLIRKAIQKLAETTGVEVEVTAQEYLTDQGGRIDALAKINGDPNQHIFAIETKQNLTTANAGQAIEQLRAVPFKGILITDYVNPKMAERLKEMNIAFIDLAGNAYINNTPVYIYIRGNKPIAKPAGISVPKPTRAFQATGLKVVFGILINPDEQNKGYATEAIRLLSNYLFNYLNLHKVYATTSENNSNTIKLLKSLGFHQDGVMRDHHFYNGQYYNQMIFSLISNEYK